MEKQPDQSPDRQSPDRKMRDAPELLADLYAHTARIARDQGMDNEHADLLALAVTESIASHWGGQIVYVAKGARMRLSKRDLDIWRDFTGRNHAELAEKYDVSVQWIYAILKRVRDEIARESQPGLF